MVAPHNFPPDPLNLAKRLARQRARARRDGGDPAVGASLATHLLAAAPPPPGAIVGGYWPLPREIDIRPLLHSLHARGYVIGLAEVVGPATALRFRRWQPGAALRAGAHGTAHPDGAEIVPTWLLVPLLGFDRQGHRLGHGGGYYDRTLAGLPGITAIGCAFAAQELDEVPTGPYDARLTRIATEFGVIETAA